jgi:hypothetical protein
MEIGFIVDKLQNGARLESHWVEGPPEYSWFGGVKTGNRRMFKVVTYRCARCGYLESYALGP